LHEAIKITAIPKIGSRDIIAVNGHIILSPDIRASWFYPFSLNFIRNCPVSKIFNYFLNNGIIEIFGCHKVFSLLRLNIDITCESFASHFCSHDLSAMTSKFKGGNTKAGILHEDPSVLSLRTFSWLRMPFSEGGNVENSLA
jgi:hypothetical protein